MQPSQLEIQREVEALRDIRRRSTTQGGPGALILDPDLPNPSSPTSPTAGYWSTGATQQLVDGDSGSSSHEDSSSSEERASNSDDPFHLFWVPASLHPEIAPAEFRAFLKEHARGPPPDGVNVPTRSSSLGPSSAGLGRKRSMLSRQYKPSENDDVEEEKVVPLRRNRTLLTNAGPQLTISDLQRLEQLAEEASTSDDPSKLRNVLRRSLSLNVSPSVIDKMDNMPDMPDEADAPIIVPPPGQILRRAARTKIRKPSLPGDGGGHRFGAGRRPRGATVAEPRTSSDLSSNDHMSSSDHGDGSEPLKRPRAFSNESMTSDGHSTPRPESYSEETSIYDSYAREEPEEEASRQSPSAITPKPPVLSLSPPDDQPSPSKPLDTVAEPQPTFTSAAPILHHPQPQRLTISPPAEDSSRTPSPDASTLAPSTEETAVASTSGEAPPFPSKSPSPVHKKEKDKKGLFKWGSSGGSAKKNGKEREKDSQRAEKEKESGFFGWLPGKKKRDDQASQSPGYGKSGRETAADMLGPSKSYVPSPSPQIPGTQGSYARYPIHVERAIYRLSHIKLANPRRPLYEQVLISNLMFWYLGVINKTQSPTTPPPSQAQGANPSSPSSPAPESEQVEDEQKETEEQQRAEEERVERDREREKEREREREKEKEKEQHKKESPRRGTLTKTPSGSQGGRRAAEMPVKGPQYEMQHRVMEQEYNGPGYGYGATSSTPQGGGPPRMQRQPSPPVQGIPAVAQPQPSNHKYSGYPGSGAADSKQLPPGAMPPASVDQVSWPPSTAPSTAPIPRTQNSPSPPPPGSQQAHARPPHRSRSPPAQNHNRYSPATAVPNRVQASRTPTRSLSATAGPSPPISGDGKARKVTSVHAVMTTPNGRPRTSISSGTPRGEEEDVPLALWQQQRRK
ncbi:hypothetical protein BV22DRAFT_1013572 [Leucogyrophana mollusca]|uniref:Uncharacterized protein n=1 Tax=Leucogyrophana mollusca TaxID=85980 RepID=A0ACB8BEM9_9AGAM|nr:hypothetical protein BV22DRAFT_1013572 [Leucogyrophana mollusca]